MQDVDKINVLLLVVKEFTGKYGKRVHKVCTEYKDIVDIDNGNKSEEWIVGINYNDGFQDYKVAIFEPKLTEMFAEIL